MPVVENEEIVKNLSPDFGKIKELSIQLSKRGGILYCEDCGDRVLISGKAVIYAISDIFV